MTAPVGRWRATYTPGDWIVLSGPTSVVVLEPATHQWASLVPVLWDEVVGSSSLVELATALAGYRIDTMPSFAAFFWTDEGMRSLVRGSVSVLDPTTGSLVATGEGIQTWSEVGLEGLTQVQVELPNAVPDPTGPELSLPLVVGVVRASALLLDASDEAQLFSPQEFYEDEGYDETQDDETQDDELETEPEGAEAVEGAAAEADPEEELEGPTTELMADPFPDPEAGSAEPAAAEPAPPEPAPPEPEAEAAAPDVPTPPAGGAGMDPALLASIENGDTEVMAPVPVEAAGSPEDAEDMIMAVVCQYGHSSAQNATVCRVCGTPIVPQGPRLVPRPALALLRASDGSTVEVDRAVLLGRAPSAGQSNARAPRLMTVPSPGHDISRTHVEVAPDGWQIVVTDLRSTNGTVLVRPGSGERQQLPPGEAVPVPVQSLLELGDGVSILIDFPQ